MLAYRIPFVSRVPAGVKRMFSVCDSPSCPEAALMREKVARAVMDAAGYTGLEGKKHDRAVRLATVWLRMGEDTDVFCDFGGLDFDGIRRAYSMRGETDER